MYEFLQWRMQVNVLQQLNMTYETSTKEATEFVKSETWTHALSQEPELESGALDLLRAWPNNIPWWEFSVVLYTRG